MTERNSPSETPVTSHPSETRRILGFVEKVDRWVAMGEEIVMTVMLLGLMLTAVGQSLMRNFKVGSGQTLSNMLLLIKYQTFFLGIVGASLATRHNRHINVDVLSMKLRKRGRQVLRVITGVAVITLASFLVLAAHEFIASQQLALVLERHPSRKVLWSIRELHVMWAVFVVFCLLLAHLVVRWIIDIGGLVLSAPGCSRRE